MPMLNIKRLQDFIVPGMICATAFITSCEKPKPPPIKFSISGYKDVTLPENGSETVPVKVTQESGTNEQVTLSIEGLPVGISAFFTVETNKPDFTSNLYLKDDSSKGGNYIITLRGKSGAGVIMDYPFSLTTLDKTCAKKTAGLYNGSTVKRDGTGDVFTSYSFNEDAANIDRLLFTWNSKTVYMILNCSKNLLTIPLQDVGSFKIQGKGYIDLNYTIIHFEYMEKHNNGDTMSCVGHFVKQ